MTELTIRNMGKFIYQNNAETTDYFPGCLQDNFVLSCNRGFAFCYEQYVNQWNSCHIVFFVPYGNEKEILHYSTEFDVRRDAAEKEAEEIEKLYLELVKRRDNK